MRMKRQIIDKIQVNIPFTMLYDSYLDLFIEQKLNPEIGIDAVALKRFSLSDFSNIAELFHKHSRTITLHAPFDDMSPGSQDPAVRGVTRKRFEQMLQLVPLFRPKTVVCHASYDRKRYSYYRDLWIENSLEMFSWLGACVSDEGGQLMLENVYEHSPDDIRILFERLEAYNVGFCLDTGHQAAFSRTSLAEWMDALEPYLEQLHLHDNFCEDDDHIGLGQGKIDFVTFFEHIKTIKKEPPIITLEPHKEEYFQPSVEYLEKVWPW